MFTDQVQLQLRAGKGGNGVVAWRREKYIPKGGPCGGDGGKGASIIFEADCQIRSLDTYRNRRLIKADDGNQGGSNNRKGRNGKDLVLKVPPGTLVKDRETKEILCDITENKERFFACQGGKGGFGNTRYKTPTNRAPNKCTPGRDGGTLSVELELKLIADVGFVGFPNAGKSTLLKQLSNASVKTAAYPFTTLRPNLGYHKISDYERILFADIPGIIDGAHENRGLGHEFLRHIERTKVLLFVIDASGFEGRDPLEDLAILKNELGAYNPMLLKKPCLVALNKADMTEEMPKLDEPHVEISALTGQGIDEIVTTLSQLLKGS